MKAWVGKRVLLISAHPDDIEGTMGGTVALLTTHHTEVFFLIITNGNKGCSNTMCKDWSSAQIAAQRRIEAVNAARILGVPESNVVMLAYDDAQLTSYPHAEVKASVLAAIRRVKPQIIMTWWPYPRFELKPSLGWADLGFHPDHQAAGRFALEAQFEAGLELLLPELGPASHVEQFYMWDFVSPSHYTDITSTLSLKVKAFQEHKTQYQDPNEVNVLVSMLGERMANITGARVRYAEGFQAFF